jgi:uncharacterized protein
VNAQILVERDLEVPMRDGTTLRADVYRAPDGAPSPVLLERTPYSKSYGRYVGGLVLNPLEAVERGYTVVVQDVRGRYRSEGEWEPFVHETDDGVDTIAWAAEQPWSNGRVGLYGASYMGVTALQAAVAAPPAVGAVLAYMAGSEYHSAWSYSGGAFELKFSLVWTLRSLTPDTLRRLEPGKRERLLEEYVDHASDPWGRAHTMPLAELEVFEEGAPYWRRWLEHPAYDDYWGAVDVARRADGIKAPLLHVSGWYDHFLRGHLELFRELDDAGAEQRFMIGPWDHGSYHSTTQTMAGERDFGPRAANGTTLMTPLAFSWFDRWLRDDEQSELPPKVRYFVMGENRWHTAESWPPEHTPTPWYFRGGGSANTRGGDGALESSPSADGAEDSYVYDPRTPVPTVGGRGTPNVLGLAGVQDQGQIEDREDVLCYTSTPLSSALTIAGPVTVQLHVSASTPDTDFTAKLVDVQPDGYCAILTEGILRARYRNSQESEELLEPDEVVEVTIDLWAVAHTFAPGHRVRLEISGGSFPRWNRNPNNGAQPATATEQDLQPSTHRVFHGADRASCVVLPVIARKESP